MTKSKHLDNLDSDVPLKERIFLKLNKYPNISTNELCKLLKLDYTKYANTIYSYRYEWKESKRKDRQRLKSLSFHAVRYFGYELESIDRMVAVGVGWKKTRARNKMLLWKDRKYGRIEWFKTGRINCWCRKPASLGKMKQLLAEGFFKTGLVFDVNVFDKWAESFRLKGFHLVLKTGERLPYATIKMLKDDTGVVATIGDASHKDGLELQIVLPDFREKQEQLQMLTNDVLERNIKIFKELFGSNGNGISKPDKPSGYIS